MGDAKLSPYDFPGIIAPGATLVLACLVLAKGAEAVMQGFGEYSVGGFGLFAVLCYVTGHLVQAIGNVLAIAWWAVRGRPSTWLFEPKQRWKVGFNRPLLAAPQRERLIAGFLRLGLIGSRDELTKYETWQWEGLTAEVYAWVAAAKRQQRVDTFNANFGLHRGLMAGLVIAFVIAVATHKLVFDFLFGIGGLFAFFRMTRFARHYARELYVQFLTTLDSNAQRPSEENAGDGNED